MSIAMTTVLPEPVAILNAVQGDAAADLVDEFVFFDAILSPLGLEEQLFLALLFGAGDGHEIGADVPAINHLIGDALGGEAKMAGRFVERRVDDRVLDDNLAHNVPILRGIDSFHPRKPVADPFSPTWPSPQG